MKTKLVRVGNSQAVRIPKPLIEQAGLQGDLEIEVKNHAVVIRSVQKLVVTAPKNGLTQKPKRKPAGKKSKSWVDVLLACPERGWFEPATSESTDEHGS